MKQHKPSHPGKILMDMYMAPLSLSLTKLAVGIKVARSTLSDIIHQRRGIGHDMAIRLSKAFGTTPKLWLNLQDEYDLYKAEKKFKIKGITLFRSTKDTFREIHP